MKRIVCCIIAAIFLLLESAQATEGVRLHVIGETDWANAQAYKLLVRDQTLELIANGEPELESALNAWAESQGRAANITVESGTFPYPDGDHAAIRVRIGRAEGRNWWGLIYPEQIGHTGDTIYYSAIVDWLLDLLGID